VVKRLFPSARVTHISKDALGSVWKWEHLCQARLDKIYPPLSYELAEEHDSVDLIFCFASAHHFGAHRRTLREISRVLRPGGKCLYLYEPSCPRYLHPFAYRRVNRIRPSVPEDVLVHQEIQGPLLRRLLPCTANYEFTKPEQPPSQSTGLLNLTGTQTNLG
jgi:SAM-dependent methyltransferase